VKKASHPSAATVTGVRPVTGPLAAVALLLALAGCGPSIDTAIENCAQAALDTLAETQDGGLTAEEKDLVLPDLREMCQSFADDDPEGFLEEWG
jgi:hypothetical protein